MTMDGRSQSPQSGMDRLQRIDDKHHKNKNNHLCTFSMEDKCSVCDKAAISNSCIQSKHKSIFPGLRVVIRISKGAGSRLVVALQVHTTTRKYFFKKRFLINSWKELKAFLLAKNDDGLIWDLFFF